MSDLKYERILRFVASEPWAILPQRMSDILDVLAYQAGGGKLSADDVREYMNMAAARPARASNAGGVAVLGLRGIISHRIEQVQDISGPGGTSVEGFRGRLRDALASSQVGSVVIDIDSPGGSVDGVPELAEEIHGARGDKPIIAVANTLAASAAYYLASQADEVVVTPSGEVGSIGVFAAHEDVSDRLAQQGRHMTLISAGKYKVEGNPFEPLSEDARLSIQGAVDRHYNGFVDAVARGRGVSVSRVRAGFGEGRTVDAHAAVAEGMADSVGTLEQTIQRMQARASTSRMRAGPTDPAEFEFL